MMRVISSKNTSIEKEKVAYKGLLELIEIDKKNSDKKSLKYHKMALKEAENTIKKLEKLSC